MDKDVTSLVEYGLNDDESLPLYKCVCGNKYGLWDHILGIYPDMPTYCCKCGRALYFKVEIKVYEVDYNE